MCAHCRAKEPGGDAGWCFKDHFRIYLHVTSAMTPELGPRETGWTVPGAVRSGRRSAEAFPTSLREPCQGPDLKPKGVHGRPSTRVSPGPWPGLWIVHLLNSP